MNKIPLLLLCLSLLSCKKDSIEERHCWQIIDAVGNDLNQVCNKTEAELLECASNGTCGTYNGGTGLTSCNYYIADEERFCWQINGNYFDSLTTSQANLYATCFYNGATAVKINCSNCAWWFHREKRTYKPSSTFTFSTVTREKFCGDTTATLFQGRQIIRKDDADSLIVIQFSSNGINW